MPRANSSKPNKAQDTTTPDVKPYLPHRRLSSSPKPKHTHLDPELHTETNMKIKLDPDSDNHHLDPKADTSKANSSTASPTSGRAAVSRESWTGDELEAIFTHVAKKVGGPSSFEGAVEGRTGRQTYMAWR